MAKRSTAHTASAHDSTAPDDSTIPLGEVPEATEVLGAEEETIGATRNPYQRRSSASGTAQMPHVPDPHSPPTPAQGYPAAPHSAGAYDADPTEHLPYSADPQFSSSPQYAQAPSSTLRMRSTVARLGMWLMGLRRRRPVPPLRGTPIPGGLVHALFCSIFCTVRVCGGCCCQPLFFCGHLPWAAA